MEPQPPSPIAEWGSRRVLVTGADGFVGRWLIQSLAAANSDVCALVRPNSSTNEKAHHRLRQTGIDFVEGDITNLAFISKLIADREIDTVYHLAAINVNTGSKISPYEIFETNTRSTYTILEACRLAPKPARAIIASSKEVEDCFLPESNRKFHPYMTSKAAAELITRAFGDTFQLPVVLVRSDNLYGGGDLNWDRLVPGTMRSVIRGETPVIRSNGLFQRDYVYVEDAVAAYMAIGAQLDNPAVRGKLFRITSGTGTSVLNMVKQIIRVAGLTHLEPRILNEKSAERVDSFYTPEMEQTVLGWKCQHTLEEGLSRTHQWYRDFSEKTSV